MERGTSRRTAGDPMRHFSKLNDSVELPARATKGSAGYDIRVTNGDTIFPGETV